MGLKEIFRKEEKYLGQPKQLPDLASEELSDDFSQKNFVSNSSQVNNSDKGQESLNSTKSVPGNLETSPGNPSDTNSSSPQNMSQAQQPSQGLNNSIQQPNHMHPIPFGQQMNNHPNYPLNYNPYMHYAFSSPVFYPPNYFQNQQSPHHIPFSNFNHDSVMASTSFDSLRDATRNSDRGPLRKLLAELDRLESRWHSLSNQKTGLEKELKYLESEIEHKMKLLRTHLAIANETNVVRDGDEFHLADGQVLRSRADLEAVSESMSKLIFDHHVGPGWNDFESWAANCLHDYSLAKRLKHISNVRELQTALKKY